MEDVPNGVVTANEGVVTPLVLGLPAEWASEICVPDCHAEPTPETVVKRGVGIWVSGEFGRECKVH